MFKVRENWRNMVKIGVAFLAVVAVSISCKKNDAKQITAFSFSVPPAVGVIDESSKSITVAVPAGTDVTALVPTIMVSEMATVSPLSGLIQDFTNPVQYKVVAEDGSTVSYMVTVMVGSGGKESVVINGVRWATCNVEKPGTFSESPESAGMFYQWNRNIGWSATNSLVNSNGGTTWDTSIPDGETWEKVNDPSPIGYRLPTSDDIMSLFDTIHVSNIWTTQNGTNGILFTDKVNGNSVFLPAAGILSSINGWLYYAGTNGHYWSSMQGGIPHEAGGLIFYSDSTGWSAEWREVVRNFGFSVRPVAE